MYPGDADDEARETYPDWLAEAFESGSAEPGREGSGSAESGGAESAAASPLQASEGGLPIRRTALQRLDLSITTPYRVSCRVTVSRNGRAFEGAAQGMDVPGSRAATAARATLRALEEAHAHRAELVLQELDVVRALAGDVVLVAIHATAAGEDRSLVGASTVRDSLEDAAVLASLQATNRWLGRARPPAAGGR